MHKMFHVMKISPKMSYLFRQNVLSPKRLFAKMSFAKTSQYQIWRVGPEREHKFSTSSKSALFSQLRMIIDNHNL